jgi:hypothetical protein
MTIVTSLVNMGPQTKERRNIPKLRKAARSIRLEGEDGEEGGTC